MLFFGNKLHIWEFPFPCLELPTPITARPTTTTTTHVDVWRPIKHANQNGKYNAEGTGVHGQGNIKHAKNHRRKYPRKGHRTEVGEYPEGGEDSSADLESLTTASSSSSGGGLWGDRTNSRNSQRNGKDASNSINSYDRNSNNNRYDGGAMDHPNLDAPSSSRSSRLISVKFTATPATTCGLLHQMLTMTRFHSQLYFITVAVSVMLIPLSTCHVLFNI